MPIVCMYSNSVGIWPVGISYRDMLEQRIYGSNLKCFCDEGMSVCEPLAHFSGRLTRIRKPSASQRVDAFSYKEAGKCIVNLGVVCCSSRRVDTFIIYVIDHLLRFGITGFETFVIYKLKKIAEVFRGFCSAAFIDSFVSSLEKLEISIPGGSGVFSRLEILRESAQALISDCCGIFPQEFLSIFTESEFESLYYKLFSKLSFTFGCRNVIGVGISCSYSAGNRRPSIEKYNNILSCILKELNIPFIDCNYFEDVAFGSDGIHFTAYGHSLVFEEIKKIFNF